MNTPAKTTPAVPTKDQELIDEVAGMPEAYKNLAVKTLEDCEFAANVLKESKASIKILEDRRKLITSPMDAAKKSVMDLFRPAVDAAAKLEKIIKPKISAYYSEQERLQKIAEAEAAEKQRKEREKLEAQADKARAKGQIEKAEALEVQSVTQVSVVAPAPQRVSGVSVRKSWVAEVTDPIAVCKLIAEGLIPPTVLDFKQSELNKIASTWQNSKEFAGLKISQQSIVASR